MSNSNHTGPESTLLVIQAFLLDTQIENPEGYLIVEDGKSVLASQILAENPNRLNELIEERAKVYRQLGWEVPDAG